MIDGVTAKDIYTRRILYVYVGDAQHVPMPASSSSESRAICLPGASSSCDR